MSREYVAPTIEIPADTRHSDSIERHPAYGQIGASRVSGSAELYGSDFKHQHFINIRLYRSELHRGLSNDRAMARGQLVEVSMTEAQWATFVSSLNTGFGVQCTIERLPDEDLPAIKRDVNRRTQFEKELNERLRGVEESMKVVSKMVQDLPCSQKKKDEILHLISVATQNMGPNLKFTADQFGEYMEETTERAKMEINAYAQHLLQRLATSGPGLEAPTSPVRFLEGQVVDDEPKL